MVLTGFVLAMLGVIVFIHGQHYEIGILISFAGVDVNVWGVARQCLTNIFAKDQLAIHKLHRIGF